jgi:hypothetical protein
VLLPDVRSRSDAEVADWVAINVRSEDSRSWVVGKEALGEAFDDCNCSADSDAMRGVIS